MYELLYQPPLTSRGLFLFLLPAVGSLPVTVCADDLAFFNFPFDNVKGNGFTSASYIKPFSLKVVVVHDIPRVHHTAIRTRFTCFVLLDVLPDLVHLFSLELVNVV